VNRSRRATTSALPRWSISARLRLASPIRGALLCLAAVGCTQPVITLNPTPIPVAIQGDALAALARIDDGLTLQAIIDTGSPLTVYDDGLNRPRGHLGYLRLLSSEGVPRLELGNVQLFTSPLRAVGRPGATYAVSAILGGDNLSRFVVGLDYQDPPRVNIERALNTCSCALADACQAVFKFTPLGGNQTFSLGGDLYNYPPSRVVLDVCAEPLPDPLQEGIPCAGNAPSDFLPFGVQKRYAPSGQDMKLLVATGFPGVLLSANAYDRLRGQGATDAAIKAAPLKIRLPDIEDDDEDRSGVNEAGDGLTVAEVDLGGDGHSALAVVSRERYFGPCAELSRSRRQRRVPPGAPIPPCDPTTDPTMCMGNRGAEAACLQKPDTSLIPAVVQCTNGAECDDAARNPSPTAAIIELTRPIKVFVTRDSAPILVSVNADVRRGPGILGGAPSVDGIIGTDVLRRLRATIDYPNGRFIARCRDADCLAYRRYITDNECGLDCIPIECTIGRRNPGRCRCTADPPLPGVFNDGLCAALPDQKGGLCPNDP
jgi:hypothetical protein